MSNLCRISDKLLNNGCLDAAADSPVFVPDVPASAGRICAGAFRFQTGVWIGGMRFKISIFRIARHRPAHAAASRLHHPGLPHPKSKHHFYFYKSSSTPASPASSTTTTASPASQPGQAGTHTLHPHAPPTHSTHSQRARALTPLICHAVFSQNAPVQFLHWLAGHSGLQAWATSCYSFP